MTINHIRLFSLLSPFVGGVGGGLNYIKDYERRIDYSPVGDSGR